MENEKKAEAMTLQKISLDEFLRLRKLVHRSARPLDYTKWKFLFENGCYRYILSVRRKAAFIRSADAL